ncbi:MAG: hypothetical protein WAU34_09350 [Desulfobacterales bacterium]
MCTRIYGMLHSMASSAVGGKDGRHGGKSEPTIWDRREAGIMHQTGWHET